MSLITETLFGTENKVEKAIETLKLFEPPEGYYVAFSGGKDSITIKELCNMAGVKYDAHYRITSVDPPELVQYIKKYHPDVSRDFPRYKDGTIANMWNLIPKLTMPPTRFHRYCCDYLKEDGGEGRMVVTGVRWAESKKRKDNQGIVSIRYNGKQFEGNPDFETNKYGGARLLNDNNESRELIEGCYQKNKVCVNPIIDWTDEDVWEFIKERNLPYCELYDKGYKRLGCIACPMIADRALQLEQYPKYRDAYIRAFERMLAVMRKARDENPEREFRPLTWDTGEDVMRWWLAEDKDKDRPLDGQIEIGEEHE